MRTRKDVLCKGRDLDSETYVRAALCRMLYSLTLCRHAALKVTIGLTYGACKEGTLDTSFTDYGNTSLGQDMLAVCTRHGGKHINSGSSMTSYRAGLRITSDAQRTESFSLLD